MKRKYLHIRTIILLILLSSCSTIRVAEEQNVNKSIDIVFFHNIILKTPDFSKSDIAYDSFYRAMIEIKKQNINFNELCNIKSNDIEIWKNVNKYAKNNISMLNFNDKDFKTLNIKVSETEYSKVYSVPSDDKNIFCPFIHLEVEYTDKSIGTINVVFYNDKIAYVIYSEVQPITNEAVKDSNHKLHVKIDYYPNGNVKSYYSKSSYLNYKIGKYCEYSEDGIILKDINVEEQFNLNLNKVFSIINNYQKVLSTNDQYIKRIQINDNNQDIAFPADKAERFLDTNYGKVWIIKRRNDRFLIDDSNSSVIAKDNFIEFSKEGYEQKYPSIDFREIEKELGKKVLIINNSDDFGIN